MKNELKVMPATISLSAAEFQLLADIPAEQEWFTNIHNHETRRAYIGDIRGFMQFMGINQAIELRSVTRHHVSAWRKRMVIENKAPTTIRRKMAALSSLFRFLCEEKAVQFNPVADVERPKVESYEGKTPTYSTAEVRLLLKAPNPRTLKGMRDRAILSVLAYHGLRRSELCKLRVKDAFHRIMGVPHFHVHGKGGKNRNIPAQKETIVLIEKYLTAAGHKADLNGPLFRPSKTKSLSYTGDGLSTAAIYTHVVKKYMEQVGIDDSAGNYGPHAFRASFATHGLNQGRELSEAQLLLGHENISTTKMYDRREKSKPTKTGSFVKY